MSDRLQQLNSLLLTKLKQVVVIHKECYNEILYTSAIRHFDDITPAGLHSIQEALVSTDVAHLRDIAREHLVVMIDALLEASSCNSDGISLCGKAWVHYALACLKLYVPNVAFD